MKKILLSLMIVLSASLAWAVDPKPYLGQDSAGQIVVYPGLPSGTAYDARILKISDEPFVCFYWVEGSRAKLAIFKLSVEEFKDGPQPDPKPNPQPIPPDPIPVPPADVWGVVIVSESGTQTPEQGKAITSKALDDLVAAKKWQKVVFDPDVKDETGKQPEKLVAWKSKAKSLPWFFLIDKNGSIIKEGSVTTEAALLSTVGGKP
jgi:hypothetical protein